MFREAKLFRRGTVEEKLYHVWYNMIARCYDPGHSAYPRYGRRGVKVCSGWKTDFLSFLEWAREDYRKGLWLDREDANGSYSPDNCRWVTPTQSRDNTPRTCRITAFGETKTASEWSRDARCVVKHDTLRARIRYGYSGERAISTPKGVLK